MRHRLCVYLALVISAQTALGVGFLDNAAVHTVAGLKFNDAVYDSTRGVVYASVPSSQGFPYGNSIAAINPSSLTVVNSWLAGSEPTRLAISSDNSRVAVGIDGARAFRTFQPGTGSFGPLRSLLSNFGDPAVVEDLAISPTNPSVVIVSKDEVGSSAAGDLEVFDDTGSIGGSTSGFFSDANQIAFVNGTTMISYNDDSTAYSLQRWSFNGSSLTKQASINGLISGWTTDIEVADGLIYASNGMVVNPFTLTALGTFGATGAIEPIPSLGITYFYSNGVLRVFDNASFLQYASRTVGGPATVTDLFVAGNGKLGFKGSDGTLGVISGVPTPEPTVAFSLLVGGAVLFHRRERIVRR